ncbi:MAG: hypothetical protein DMG51_15420 [Acidobacteria bacterium]|nr:MAG: hypothetical protein DMG51_15420 [Acidobacteriota bacterium]
MRISAIGSTKGRVGKVSHQAFGKMPFYDHRTPAAPWAKIGSNRLTSACGQVLRHQKKLVEVAGIEPETPACQADVIQSKSFFDCAWLRTVLG